MASTEPPPPPPFVSAFKRTLLCIVVAPDNMSSGVGDGALEISTAPNTFMCAVPHTAVGEGNDGKLTPLQEAVIAAEEKRFAIVPLYLNKPRPYAQKWMRTLYAQLQVVFGREPEKSGDEGSEGEDDKSWDESAEEDDDDDEDDDAEDCVSDDFLEDGDDIKHTVKKKKVEELVLEKPPYVLPVVTHLEADTVFTDHLNLLKFKTPDGEFQVHKPPIVPLEPGDRALTLLVQYFVEIDM